MLAASMSNVWALIVLYVITCGLVGAACAASRYRMGAGFVLGAALGPIGWIIALLLPCNAVVHERSRYRRR